MKGGISQEFPPLDFNNIRKREFMQYNDEERASVVYHWLVDGMTTREMDAKILGFLPDGSSHGYQSFGIYRYLGLTGKHQGFFRGWETGDIVAYLHAKSLDDDILEEDIVGRERFLYEDDDRWHKGIKVSYGPYEYQWFDD